MPQGLVHCKLPINIGYSQWTGLEYGGSQLLHGTLDGLGNQTDSRKSHGVGGIGAEASEKVAHLNQPSFPPSSSLCPSLIFRVPACLGEATQQRPPCMGLFVLVINLPSNTPWGGVAQQPQRTDLEATGPHCLVVTLLSPCSHQELQRSVQFFLAPSSWLEKNLDLTTQGSTLFVLP